VNKVKTLSQILDPRDKGHSLLQGELSQKVSLEGSKLVYKISVSQISKYLLLQPIYLKLGKEQVGVNLKGAYRNQLLITSHLNNQSQTWE
jgi:hypothetical protein